MAAAVLTPPPSSSKRLAKRSILGTRVAVRGDDGKFYSGMIQATKTVGEDAAEQPGGEAAAASEAAADAAATSAENREAILPLPKKWPGSLQ